MPWPSGVDVGQFDVIVCYALLEHLLVPERLALLSDVWSRMAERCLLVIHETPNRFSVVAWHPPDLDFVHVLPDDLALVYYRRSKRPRGDTVEKPTYRRRTEEEIRWLYRWGRGVSYHEFELAVGLESISVVNDGYSPSLAPHRDRHYGHDEAFETGLASRLHRVSPSVPRGFARPSLDLVLAKSC